MKNIVFHPRKFVDLLAVGAIVIFATVVILPLSCQIQLQQMGSDGELRD